MNYSELIRYCQLAIQSFNTVIMTPSSHIENFMQEDPISDANQINFVNQIFYGVERYSKFLNASSRVLCSENHPTVQIRKDAILLAIFTYILIFRLNQLPIKEFQKMVRSQDRQKMQILLYSLFDQNYVREKLVPVWRQHLQEPYLEKIILPALADSKDRCWDVLLQIKNQAQLSRKTLMNLTHKNTTNNSQLLPNASLYRSSLSQKRHTTFQDFKLTKPKPRLLPQPERISNQFIARPKPKQRKSLGEIYTEKQARRSGIRQSLRSFYSDRKSEVFKLETMKRPLNLPKLLEEAGIKQKHQLETKFSPLKMPSFKQVQIRQNVASILRQEQKINQRIAAEQKKMNQLLINLHDQTQHQLWRKQIQQKDRYASMQQQQRRKLELELSREAAMEAFQNNIRRKKEQVSELKELADQFKVERAKLMDEQMKNNKRIIENIYELRENVIVERNHLLENNRKIHDQEKRNRKRIKNKKKVEEQIQMQKKKELISEIREFQKNLKNSPKNHVQPQISIGFLYQMTIDQLKRRLVQVKAEQKKVEEQRRNANVLRKQDFKDSLTEKKNRIAEYKNQMALQKSKQLKQKHEEKERQIKRLEQARLKSLQEFKRKEESKLRAKKIEEQKNAKQLKEIEQRRNFMMQDKSAQQVNAFRSLERGQERQMLNRQNERLMNQYRHQIQKLGQTQIIADQSKRQISKKIDFRRLYIEQENVDNQNAQLLMQQDYTTRAMQYYQVRSYEAAHSESLNKRSPYSAKIQQMSLRNVKNMKAAQIMAR